MESPDLPSILFGWRAYKYDQRSQAYTREVERLQRLLIEPQLHAMRARLNPHFLFNVLNSISSYVEENPSTARAIVESLSDLLRAALQLTSDNETRLGEELIILRHYTELQSMRFGEPLRVEYKIADDLLDAVMPSFLLQPLVETTIEHGTTPLSMGWHVWIRAFKNVGNWLLLEVEDNGVGLPSVFDFKQDAGVGLRTTRERLSQMFPAIPSGFKISGTQGVGTLVRIEIPLRFQSDKASS